MRPNTRYFSSTVLAGILLLGAQTSYAENRETIYNKRNYFYYDPNTGASVSAENRAGYGATPAAPESAYAPSAGTVVEEGASAVTHYQGPDHRSSIYAGAEAQPGDYVPVETDLMKEAGGIRYMSGGIGEEELAQIKAHASEFNLHILATIPGGQYVGGYNVNITNSGGEQVFSAMSEGPFFYANLPSGSYDVAVSQSDGMAQHRKVTLGKGSQQVRFTLHEE